MRHLIVIASLLLLLLPVPAMAQTAPAPTLSETVPVPRALEPEGISGGRMLMISVGAVAGVIVANALTGGFITPVLLATEGGIAGTAAVDAAAVGWGIAQVAVSAVGAVVGGYIGNWFYGK